MFKKTETEFSLRFVTATSGFPSPFKSPIDTQLGKSPVLKSVFAENDGVAAPVVVVFKNTENVFELLFGTTKSGLPSPLRSPIAAVYGNSPVEKSVFAVKAGVDAPGVVVLNKTETEFGLLLATTKSNFPSPFKSVIETDCELMSVLKSVLAEKVGVDAPVVVVFKKTETTETWLAVTRSGLPSPLISPTATA